MAPQFIGIDPNTHQNGSPTVWVDEQRGELIFQGWEADVTLKAHCAAMTVPGHAVGIPDGERIVRVPSRMVTIIREACDVAERVL